MKASHWAGGNRKRYQQSTNADKKPRQAAIENAINNRRMRIKIVRNSVFDCHLSPARRQMAIEISVSNDFSSSFLDSIGVFVCRLTGVSMCVSFSYWLVHEVISIFGNDVFSKHLFPMVSYTQNTHKIPISPNPRSTLLPSPLPIPLQPV